MLFKPKHIKPDEKWDTTLNRGRGDCRLLKFKVFVASVPKSIHHYRAGRALGEWLDDIGCVLLYLPTYLPEFNPAENVFNKLKTILRRFEYRELLRDSLHVAVHQALQEIATNDEDFLSSLDTLMFNCLRPVSNVALLMCRMH
jgi:hypothetical protein